MPGARVVYALSMLHDRLAHFEDIPVTGSVGDTPVSAGCVMLEIMLMRHVGPNMFRRLVPTPRTAVSTWSSQAPGIGMR